MCIQTLLELRRHLGAEIALYVLKGDRRVLYRIMQDPGGYDRVAAPGLRQHNAYGGGMGYVRNVHPLAHLSTVGHGRYFQRPVYLPEGSQWTDAWTGETIPGGTEVTAAAPLARIPLYLRDGATLPITGR